MMNPFPPIHIILYSAGGLVLVIIRLLIGEPQARIPARKDATCACGRRPLPHVLSGVWYGGMSRVAGFRLLLPA
jgi:hypothetical protein